MARTGLKPIEAHKNGYTLFSDLRADGETMYNIVIEKDEHSPYQPDLRARAKGKGIEVSMQTTSYGALTGEHISEFAKEIQMASKAVEYFNKKFNH